MATQFDQEVAGIRGRLTYILENCLTAYKELCRINTALKNAMNKNSTVNPQPLGDLNRMIQDYLIVRVAGLFDEDSRVVSFSSIFHNNEDFQVTKQESIIRKIIDNRHNWVAHNNKNGTMISTEDICKSNLEEVLERMNKMINK